MALRSLLGLLVTFGVLGTNLLAQSPLRLSTTSVLEQIKHLPTTASGVFPNIGEQAETQPPGTQLGKPLGESQAVSIPVHPGLSSTKRADFNGDGRSDLIWRNVSSGMVYVMYMNGFAPPSGAVVWTESNPLWQIVATGDLDGDGKADLVWWNRNTGMVYAMLLDGLVVKSGSVVHVESDTVWQIEAAADFDGDGKADLLWRHGATGMVYLMPMNGAVQMPGAVIWTEPNLEWQIMGAGDFDHDGKADILWRNNASGMNYLMLMNGTTVHRGLVLYTEPDPAWRMVALLDFNGDGTTDLLWRNASTGMVYAIPIVDAAVQPGMALWTEPSLDWQIVATGDYDGDGMDDLCWWNRTTGLVYQMQLNGLTLKGGSAVWAEPDVHWTIQGRLTKLVLEDAPPQIFSFNASPATIEAGQNSVLSFAFSGGVGIITPGNTIVLSGGTLPVSPSETTTFTLTVTPTVGSSVSGQTTVTVNASPDATITTQLPGAPYITQAAVYGFAVKTQAGCTYQWSFLNGNPTGAVILGTSSAHKVNLYTGSTLGTLALQCVVTSNATGRSDTKNLSLILVPAPVIHLFMCEPGIVASGGSATMMAQFTTSNGEVGSIDGGIGIVSSGVKISTGSITSPTVFTLSVKNLAGTVVTSIVSVCVEGQPGSQLFYLMSGRFSHKASLLPNGKVLLSGGFGLGVPHAEIIDPANPLYHQGLPMRYPRFWHTATTLPDGRVLVVGGNGSSGTLAKCEIFDPATGLFTETGSMGTPRAFHTATLLDGGKVLISGGSNGSSEQLNSAEIFNPDTGQFVATAAQMTSPRRDHLAVRLQDGTVLVLGGSNNTAELFSPVTGLFTSISATMTSDHWGGVSVLLNNGKVLIASGFSETPLAAEVYDPSSQTFSPTNSQMPHGLAGLTATLLPDGRVVFAGGGAMHNSYHLEIYDPATSTFAPFGFLQKNRSNHTATLVSPRRILFTGGQGSGETTAELYDMVSVPVPLSIELFKAEPSSIKVGEGSTLSFVFKGGNGVITPGNIAVTSGATLLVNPSETTKFTLTVTPPSGESMTAEAIVSVQSVPDATLSTNLPIAPYVTQNTTCTGLPYYQIIAVMILSVCQGIQIV